VDFGEVSTVWQSDRDYEQNTYIYSYLDPIFDPHLVIFQNFVEKEKVTSD